MATETIETPTATTRYLITGLVEEAGALDNLSEKIKTLGGEIIKTEDLGLRRLAFPIAKKTELQLVSVFFEAQPSMVNDLNNQLKHDSQLKRFIITTWSVDPTELPVRGRRAKAEMTSSEEE